MTLYMFICWGQLSWYISVVCVRHLKGMLFLRMNSMKSSDWMKCVRDLKMKWEVGYSQSVLYMFPWQLYGISTDLHAELTRQNKKKNQTLLGRLSNVTTSEGQGADSSPHITTPSNQTHHPDVSTPAVPMETSSPLIKANPSPQGTPLHTTFTGTQRFTPSTRISALNMVGDLLRKVGVSVTVNIMYFQCLSYDVLIHQTCIYMYRHWNQGWHHVGHTFQQKTSVDLVPLVLWIVQGTLCGGLSIVWLLH